MKTKYFGLLISLCLFTSGIVYPQKNSPLYFNTFDEGDMKGSQRECHDKGCHDCASEKIVIKPDPQKKGKSLHHVLWNCDERAELKVSSKGRADIGDTRWYRVSYYWPVNRGNGCIIAQFPTYPTQRKFRDACGGNGSHIKLNGDASVSFEFQRPTKENDVTCTKYTLGEMTTGQWHTVIVHVKWTQDADGFLEVWWDGVKKVDVKNQATFWDDEDRGPYFKVGAYKGDPWKGAEPFEIYTDDVYVFGEDATYKDVMNAQP